MASDYEQQGRTKRMHATARMASVVSSARPARRHLIRSVRPRNECHASIMRTESEPLPILRAGRVDILDVLLMLVRGSDLRGVWHRL